MKIKTLLFSLALVGSVTSAQAQFIGIDIGTSSNSTPLTPTSLAGAPGARVGNWNSIAGPTTTGASASSSSLTNSAGTAVTGSTFTFTGGTTNYGGSFNAATPSTNDTLLYDSVFDQYNGTAGTFSMTNVPYSTYNLYVYVYSDNGNTLARGGSITVGSLTYYISGGTSATPLNNPDNTGAGYVQSTDSTSLTSAALGNYVEFTGLTASTLSGSFVAATVAGGDTTDRLKISGFEIQAVPEPSTYALMAGGLLMLVAIQARRRKLAL